MANNLSPAEWLTSSTVRIECARRDRSVSTGTGVFCGLLRQDGYYAPVLVTCRHVVAGAQRGRLHLHLAGTTGQLRTAQYHTIILDDFQARWLPHPEPTVDLCVMPVAELLVEQQHTKLALNMVDRELIPAPAELAVLAAPEEVVVVGYPNGVWDAVHNRPIVRKGITATEPHIDYMGRAEFLIDMAWLPGASGSPVFLWNRGGDATPTGERRSRARMHLLGILSASPVRRMTGAGELVNGPPVQPGTGEPTLASNLGVVVQGRKVLEFEPILEALAARGQRRWPW
jgi:hypothetical protein